MTAIQVKRGSTTYYVTLGEAGDVVAISGVAVVGKVPRYKGGKRRVPWSGAHWHVGYGTPIPKQLQPIADEAIQQKEAQP